MADLALVDVIADTLIANDAHSSCHGVHDLARRIAGAVLTHQADTDTPRPDRPAAS